MANSIRIVKKGAQEFGGVIRYRESTGLYYDKSDTLEIKEDWRPGNYKQLEQTACECGGPVEPYFEAGFTACLKALGEI
jgi:hypothetical protein